jgi:Na+/phosphate symporter
MMTTSLAADGIVALVPALAVMLGANIGTALIVKALSNASREALRMADLVNRFLQVPPKSLTSEFRVQTQAEDGPRTRLYARWLTN